MNAFKNLLLECENHVRDGRADLVAKKLAQVNTAQIPRDLRLMFSTLCRRAGLTRQGLRILAPCVRPENQRMDGDASVEEKAEYGFLMMKNGSLREASALLTSIQDARLPEVKLYHGFVHMMGWNYQEAIPFIQAYLDVAPNEYQAVIAKVNLASALIAVSQLAEALLLIDQVIAQASEKRFQRLLANAWELRSQIFLQRGDYALCAQDLARASAVLSAEQSSDQLFILKWQAILAGLTHCCVDPIEEFRKTALARKHWESVRECDLFSLKIAFNQERFNLLYFGTPYASYRQRIERELNIQVEEKYCLLGDANGPILDMSSGQVLNRAQVVATEKIGQILNFLSCDAYRPRSLGAIFAELYPDEYFDPFSSPNRINQTVFRVRDWIINHDLPLQIIESGGQYLLQRTGPCAFLVARDNQRPQALLSKWQQLHQALSSKTRFTVGEACASLNISAKSFQRFAQWAMETGRLSRHGSSRATYYQILQA